VIHVVSISSLSSAIGTRTRFAAVPVVMGDIFNLMVDEIDEKKQLLTPSGAVRGGAGKVVKADNNGNLPSSRVNCLKDFIEHANSGVVWRDCVRIFSLRRVVGR
jgi:hypothetical protein